MRHICLDTETTGFSPKDGDRIVEIACVELENYLPTGREYHAYINPERDMPEGAFKVHGLSAEFLSNHPVFMKIADDFLNFIGDLPLVIHNAKFDMGFLNAELALIGKSPIENKIYDSMLIARKKYGGGQKLDDLCQRFGISLEGREKHGALTDTHLLAKAWLAMKNDAENKVSTTPKKETESGGLVVIEEKGIELFTREGIEALREKIEMKIASFSENPVRIELTECRDAIRSFAYNIAKTKGQIEKIGKEYLEDLKKPIQEQEKKIKEMRDFIKSVIDMVTNYQHAVRKPLTDWEEEEEKRISLIKGKILQMKALEGSFNTLEVADNALNKLIEIYESSDFQEFSDEAYEAYVCLKEKIQERIEFLKQKQVLEIMQKELENQIAQEIEAKAQALAHQKMMETKTTPQYVAPTQAPEIDKKTVNTQVFLALKKYTDSDTAQAITRAILSGKIPYISISYEVKNENH